MLENNALHDILEFAANTTGKIEIVIDEYPEGLRTTRVVMEEVETNEIDNNTIIDRLDDALDDICNLDEWFELSGHNNCTAHKKLLSIMQGIACLRHDLTKEA